jgi:hypothetical protein
MFFAENRWPLFRIAPESKVVSRLQMKKGRAERGPLPISDC